MSPSSVVYRYIITMLRIDEETKKKIIDLKNAGLGVTDISDEIGVSVSKVLTNSAHIAKYL